MARGIRGCATAAAAAAALAVPATATAFSLPGPAQKFGNPVCLKPQEESPEIYGPTDIGATTGNQRLSVAVNPQGTLSVLKWPSPSYYDQLKYFTTDRDDPRLGLEPSEGAFSGLAVELRDGTRKFRWLRDLPARQRYAGDDSDTVTTAFRWEELGLSLELADVVPPDADVLMRRHALRVGARSPVRSARLIAYANLNPTASKRPYLPTEDWCEEESGTDVARYDRGHDAIVYAIDELDGSTLRPASVAVAIGASERSDGHQVGTDHYTGHPSTLLGGPRSAYDDAADGRLSGNGRHGPAEVDAALSVPLGDEPVTVTFASAADAASATRLLERWRDRDPRAAARAKRRSYLRWLAEAPLPRDAPPAVTRLAKRALVSLRQAIDEHSGRDGDLVSIVAALSTQSPYGEDWIRDGAFFNETLDEIGHGELVERHNAFYAEVQKKLETGGLPPSPLLICAGPLGTPAGAWFMTNYADGGDAGTFSFEIDEAAFGLWTLWRHHERGEASEGYLRGIWPTLRRTAELLMAFRDPRTGLTPGTACEDDQPPNPDPPTMHASGPVLLAMRSAQAAARELGHRADAARYAGRVAELERAIDSTYRARGGAWTNGFGDGGWALWPVRVKPYDHPRMRGQAEAAWRGVAPSFRAPEGPRRRGQYEAKALHGLAHFHNAVDPAGMERVKEGLRWIAEVQAAWQETGIVGETWYVRDGEVISVVSQPHVWEQALFYLAAIEAYGRAPYEAERHVRLAKVRAPRRSGR